jgi:hypothetical protein
MQNAAKKSDVLTSETAVALSEEERQLLEKMKQRAVKAISKMPPIMVIW